MSLLDLKQLQALITVLDTLSFEQAANKLHLTQSAISQRVKQLEDHLGLPLVVRGNPLTPTTAGQAVVQYARKIDLLQNELLHDIGYHSINPSKISIGLNADSLATWFFDALQPLINKHQLIIELKVDDQEQTHKLLKTGEVMGCISSSKHTIQGCISKELGEMRYHCVSSKTFQSQYFSNGVTAQTITQAPMVVFNNKDNLQHEYLHRHFAVKPTTPSHQVPSPEMFVDFISRGLAWGMVPHIQFSTNQERLDLVDLSPDKTITVPLYWHCWNLKSEFIKEISNTIVKYARNIL